MPTFGIFAPDCIALTKRVPRLRSSALTCLLVAWPLLSHAQTHEEAEPARFNISRTAPPTPDDPLRAWFQEQDKLLDDILLRLSRIETLVRELHRLIQQFPAASAPLASTPMAPTAHSAPAAPPSPPVPATLPAPLAAPSRPARGTTGEVLAFFDAWGTLLAGGGLLLLVLMMAARNRKTKPAASAAPAPLLAPARAAPGHAPAAKTATRPAPPTAAAMAPAPLQRQALPAEAPESAHDQAMELAEIMLSMGLGHGAAQTLAEQIRHEPKQALRHWLKLLEIYRRNGQQDEFEQSAEALRLHFNVQPEDWSARPEAWRSLEDYPHIAARLTELWGKPSCLTYLQNLLDDNRGGARSGFPQAVAEELLLLTSLLKAAGIVAEASTASQTGLSIST